ncbi:HAD family hydrolase [Saccharibacillus kuerlensis]|uniref:Phosphoglycolate phosphatase n=1 Tax=Saccharibacillus kuerlensis TaxID=459527 RepID=A0ABQ2KUV1_9BACL|nr:HAD family hydrolase [Saccharibacillus kuerlensis]GGN92269.1 phosphoglycolate phosphatase [Saccharibacillus kuerlensis]
MVKKMELTPIDIIAFDLDGTLIDTSEAMLDVYHRVFEEAIENGDAEEQPSKENIYATFGMIGDEAWKTVAPDMPEEKHDFYKQRHSDLLSEQMGKASFALPGIPKMLQELCQTYELATASNCGEKYLGSVLAQDGLGDCITYKLCAGTITASRKSEVLNELKRQGEGKRIVMVGDRKSDVEAAKEAGIPVIGVRSEFAEPGELDEADAVIDRITDLPKLLNR